MTPRLVLSLFPGIGLLDRAFEAEGFTIVRGPDLLWGGDVKTFHPPAGVFDGVIGGPPCKAWSRLANLVRVVHGPESVAEDLIPEFVRVVAEAAPAWFLSENVSEAPTIEVDGYRVQVEALNARWLGLEQNRLRKFCFGATVPAGRFSTVLEQVCLEAPIFENAVTASGGGRAIVVKLGGSGKRKRTYQPGNARSFADMLRLQGLPADFLADAPFTSDGKREVVGNGVPIPMGRAIARAVLRALDDAPAAGQRSA